MKQLARTLLAMVLAAPWFAASADGIAFITNLKGDVAVDGAARPPLLAELAKGQKITVGRDSLVSIMYIASGKEYVLKGPALFVLKDTEVDGPAGMPPVLRSTDWRTSAKVLAQVSQSSAASVRMRSAAPARDDSGPRLLFPVDGAIATLQPTLRWRAPESRAPIELTLMVPGEEKPVVQARTSGSSYRVPAKLKPQTEYAWSVSIAGNEVGSGRFRTLPSEAQQRIDAHRPAERSEFSDRLLFTLMLHEMGAKQEAHESWTRLAKERADLPELSALAK